MAKNTMPAAPHFKTNLRHDLMAGYSGTPLAKKLGIKENFRIALINSPDQFEDALGALPPGVTLAATAKEPINLILFFAKSQADLKKNFARLAENLVPNGMLWVGWPKKTSGVPTDLTEGIVQKIGLAAGLVDTKVCAIDEIWSGLRFVIRVKDRPHPTK
jgi:hypothetical protein